MTIREYFHLLKYAKLVKARMWRCRYATNTDSCIRSWLTYNL